MATQFPDDFQCPISLEIMSDPVILPSGHTFDRPSIQRWLDAGHRTCPLTKLPLPEQPSLIPNHALRSLISNFTPPPSPPTNTQQLHHNRCHSQSQPQTLISTLTSPSSSLDSKLDSLDRLNRMSKTFRAKMSESGAVAAVLKCVDSGEPRLQKKALTLLLKLSLEDHNKVGMVAEGALNGIVAVLHGGSPDCRAVAATVLTSLAVVEVNKATIGQYPYAIWALVSLLRNGEWAEKKEAATALYTLCSFPDNRRRAVECGAVSILFGLAESGLDRAVEVLGLLAKNKEGLEEMQRFSGCVSILVRILVRGLESETRRGVQHTLLTLSSLCQFSERMCVEARNEGVQTICMRLVEDDNEKVRDSASNLIQVLDWNHSMI